MSTLTVVYRIEKTISIYKRYMCNLSQNNSNLLADHTHAEIVIISVISLDFFECQNEAVVQPARRSSKLSFYYENISFGYFAQTNHEGLTHLINEII